MFVELIGPPGCGKTTIARLLDEWFAGSALPYVRSTELASLDSDIGEHYLKRIGFFGQVFCLAPLLWHHPRIAVGVLFLAATHGPPYRTRFQRARRILGHFLLMLRLRRLADERVIVLDDGFVQRLWSLLVESKSLHGERLVRIVLDQYYATLAPLGVNLEIADDVTTARVFGRNSRGRFNRESGEERRQAFSRWLGYHRRLVTLLPSKAIQASIDASGEPGEVADRLAAVVIGLADDTGEWAAHARARD